VQLTVTNNDETSMFLKKRYYYYYLFNDLFNDAHSVQKRKRRHMIYDYE